MKESASKKRKTASDEVSWNFWSSPEGVLLSRHRENAISTELPSGCGTATLSEEHIQSLRDFYFSIVDGLDELVPWGDGWLDTKLRGYATLPNHSNWKSVDDITKAGICFHDADASTSTCAKTRHAAARKHKHTVQRSFMQITPSSNQLAALQEVINLSKKAIFSCISDLQPYEKGALTLQNLVAIQPNVHNGDDYLPLHLDNPRHDGFGVIIVTVALWGTADIVLVDDGDAETDVHADAVQEEQTPGATHTESAATSVETYHTTSKPLIDTPSSSSSGSSSWVFRLLPGQLYVLSGHARNKCAHGVAVLPSASYEEENQRERQQGTNPFKKSETGVGGKNGHKRVGRIPPEGRVSLNLRFGLHTAAQAYEDIDRHWLA